MAEWVADADPDNPDYEALYYDQSAIHAEFGRVVCVSFGRFNPDADFRFELKSFYGTDEAKLLSECVKWLDLPVQTPPHPRNNLRFLCGHNIRGFDIPYLGKRYLINGLALPRALRFRGRKPWELVHILDTLDDWKFGDYRGSVPLELLTELFGIPTPKEALGGEKVSTAFWKDKNLDGIAYNCERDVVATMQVVTRLAGLPLVSDSQIAFSVSGKL
jgi:hypothetical protein